MTRLLNAALIIVVWFALVSFVSIGIHDRSCSPEERAEGCTREP